MIRAITTAILTSFLAVLVAGCASKVDVEAVRSVRKLAILNCAEPKEFAMVGPTGEIIVVPTPMVFALPTQGYWDLTESLRPYDLLMGRELSRVLSQEFADHGYVTKLINIEREKHILMPVRPKAPEGFQAVLDCRIGGVGYYWSIEANSWMPRFLAEIAIYGLDGREIMHQSFGYGDWMNILVAVPAPESSGRARPEEVLANPEMVISNLRAGYQPLAKMLVEKVANPVSPSAASPSTPGAF